MVEPNAEPREQRALDISNDLLRREIGRGENMDIAHRTVGVAHQTGGRDRRKGSEQRFGFFRGPDR